MKAVCQKCKAECLFQTGPAVLSDGFACAFCGAALDCVLWSGNEPTTLSLSRHAPVISGKSYIADHNEMADTQPELSDEIVADAATVEFVNEDSVSSSEDSESSSSADVSSISPDDLGITSQDIVLTTDFDRARKRLTTLEELHVTEDTLSGEPSVAPNINALRSSRLALSDYENSSLGVRLLPISPLALLGIALASLLLIFIFDTRARQQKQALPLIPVSQAQSSQPRPPAQEKQQHTAEAVETKAAEANNLQPAPTASASPVQPVAGSGLAPLIQVNQEPVTPAPTGVEPKEAEEIVVNKSDAQTDGKFTIQVGSYPSNAEAQERISKLSSGDVEARAVRVEIPKRGTWYRVQLGRFHSREEATRFGSQLRSKGAIQDFVVAEIE